MPIPKSAMPACADCGKPTSDKNSKRCLPCHRATQRKNAKGASGESLSRWIKRPCKSCGKPCRSETSLCRSCWAVSDEGKRTRHTPRPSSFSTKRAVYEAARTGDTERTLTNPTAARQQTQQLQQIAAHVRRTDRATLNGLCDWSSMMAAAKERFADAGRFDVHAEDGRFYAVPLFEKPATGRRLYARIVNKGGNWTEHRFSGVSGVIGTVTNSGAISAINAPGGREESQ